MTDTLQHLGRGSLVQHGKSNDRVYLMKLHEEDHKVIITLLEELAQKNGYSKMVCKVPSRAMPLFLAAGFLIEGAVPRFYNGEEDAFFVARFLTDERRTFRSTNELHRLFDLLHTDPRSASVCADDEDYALCRLGKEHADAMASIYSNVFASYPFPIDCPDYLQQTMDDNVQYYGAFKHGELVAVASSEMDMQTLNAEMTDFATHPHHLGQGLAGKLLRRMEHDMMAQGIRTLYTIARLNSIAMNKTFVRGGYSYSGTLLNNTQIAGCIESMNIYYKLI